MEPDAARRGLRHAPQPVGRSSNSGGRPGDHPREVLHLNDKGVSIGSHDNPDQQAADQFNREVFEESMEIVRAALANETFSFHGKHFQVPVPGIPDRGSTVQTLTLIPRPVYPYEIWQAVTAANPRIRPCGRPRCGFLEISTTASFVDSGTHTAEYRAAHESTSNHTRKRMLVVSIRIEDTYEKARASALPGHDEFWKFLAPYGWSRGYMGENGKPAAPGLVPTLDDSIERQDDPVGTPEQFAEQVPFYKDLLGLEHLAIFLT